MDSTGESGNRPGVCLPGPRYFPEDEITDQPLRFFASELIREKVLQETKAGSASRRDGARSSSGRRNLIVIRIAAAIGVERDRAESDHHRGQGNDAQTDRRRLPG